MFVRTKDKKEGGKLERGYIFDGKSKARQVKWAETPLPPLILATFWAVRWAWQV